MLRPEDAGDAPLTVALSDTLGEIRASGISTGESVELNTSEIPEGLYFLSISKEEEVLSREQIQIVH